MKQLSAICVVTLLLLVGGTRLASAQGRMPTGEEIARAAKAAKLNLRASTTAEKNGKRVTITPIDFSKIKGSKDLEKGQVVAVVDVKSVRGLRNGRYSVFLIKVSDRWHTFFESDGKIASENSRVEVSSTKRDAKTADLQPVISLPLPGFCADICFGIPPHTICLRRICYYTT